MVPYFIMLFLVGLPMYFMELAIAQYSGLGPTRIFGRLAPVFKGKNPITSYNQITTTQCYTKMKKMPKAKNAIKNGEIVQ